MTQETQAKIMEVEKMIQSGSSVSDATKRAGISAATWYSVKKAMNGKAKNKKGPKKAPKNGKYATNGNGAFALSILDTNDMAPEKKIAVLRAYLTH